MTSPDIDIFRAAHIWGEGPRQFELKLHFLTSNTSFIHVVPGWIEAVFLYLEKKVPTWEPWQRIASMSFDEMYTNTNVDIDTLCDMAINPDCKPEVQIAVIRGTADNWKFPFFQQIGYQFTPDDIKYVALRLYDIGITLVSITCDQGGSNRGLASKLNISTENQRIEIPHPTIPGLIIIIFFIYDFVHLFKSFRNHLLGMYHT